MTPIEDDRKAAKAEAAKPAGKPTHKTRGAVGPEDPYALENELDLAASRSSAAFARCQQGAHGDIQIAFQVQPDGHVTHVQAVENTTGSPEVAACLAAVVAKWTVVAKPAQAANFVRPFSYP